MARPRADSGGFVLRGENTANFVELLPSPPRKAGVQDSRFSPWVSGFPLSRERRVNY
jgi:hypothetical protein